MKYYTEMLDQRKHSIKETWAVLRQVIHKQKESFKLPETYIVNGQETSNSYRIAEEFHKCFIGIGKSVGESVPPLIDPFHTHLRGNYAVNFFMQPTDANEIERVVQTLKTKSSEDFHSIFTKLVQETTHEVTIPLEHMINQSFVTGIVPDNLNIVPDNLNIVADNLNIAKIIPVVKSGNNFFIIIDP